MIGIDTRLHLLRDLHVALVGDRAPGHAERDAAHHQAHGHHRRLHSQPASRAREDLGGAIHASGHGRGCHQRGEDEDSTGLKIECPLLCRSQVQDEQRPVQQVDGVGAVAERDQRPP